MKDMKRNMISVLVVIGMFVGMIQGQKYQCPDAPEKIGDRRKDKNVLRVVQYNAEFLFLSEEEGCPGSECPWRTMDDAKKHLQKITGVIEEVDGDIVNICEVASCYELQTIADSLPLLKYEPYLKYGSDTATGQNVGILTRVDPSEDLGFDRMKAEYPIAGSQCGYKGETRTKTVSKHYFTTFDINGIPVAVIGAHLLAFPTEPYRCAAREAQATILREFVDYYQYYGIEVIVLGDFNDFDGEIPDVAGNVPTSKVLDIIKGVGRDESEVLTSVATAIPLEDRYSDWYDRDGDCKDDAGKEHGVLDHILVSQGLKNSIIKAQFYHGYENSCTSMFSDHWPIVVDFDVSLEKTVSSTKNRA